MPPFVSRLSIVVTMIVCAALSGCDTLEQMTQDGFGSSEPSTGEIVSGLKQALSKGAGGAVEGLAREGGYLNDSLVKIPFPAEAQFAADALNKLGLSGLVENFEQRLNQGAEAGAKRVLPIFEDAIQEMSFADAKQILFGGEHAATQYFRDRTYASLVAEFSPEIRSALGDVGAIELWSQISTRYNSLPLSSKKVDTDIVSYATGRALDGLFTKLAGEEALIRADPVARTTALLQKIFSYAEKQG